MTPLPLWVTLDGFEPGPHVERFLGDCNAYGVILFARHLQSDSQVRELCQCIHEARRGDPPVIGVDQEGGRVGRLTALGYRYPSAGDMQGDTVRVRSLALEMGELMRSLGFDVDFAPVADLGPAFAGTGLETRVYGDSPEVVSACCAAFLDGLEAAGMSGCLKHFPGLGGSRVDSHESLPLIEGDPAAREPHHVPYARLAERAPYVMVAHADYSWYGTGVPSSLEPIVYRHLAETGFRGKSVTDDLSMGAVSGFGDLGALVERSLGAGAGIALWVSTEEDTLRVVERVGESPV